MCSDVLANMGADELENLVCRIDVFKGRDGCDTVVCGEDYGLSLRLGFDTLVMNNSVLRDELKRRNLLILDDIFDDCSGVE